jgi:hypothetical protein
VAQAVTAKPAASSKLVCFNICVLLREGRTNETEAGKFLYPSFIAPEVDRQVSFMLSESVPLGITRQ